MASILSNLRPPRGSRSYPSPPTGTVRTQRSRRPPGLLWDHLDAEKRDALERWAAKLRVIVEPPPPNVVDLSARARG